MGVFKEFLDVSEHVKCMNASDFDLVVKESFDYNRFDRGTVVINLDTAFLQAEAKVINDGGGLILFCFPQRHLTHGLDAVEKLKM